MYHGLIIATLDRFVRGPRTLNLVCDMMRAVVLDHMVLQESLVGMHQGSLSLSLLSDLCLADFGFGLVEAGYPLVRYCGEFDIQCGSVEEAQAAVTLCEKRLRPLGLVLEAARTWVVAKGNSFVFRGFLSRSDCGNPCQRLWGNCVAGEPVSGEDVALVGTI